MKKTTLLSCIAAVLCFCVGFGAVALIGMRQAAPEAETAEPVLAVKNQAEGITVTSRSFYPESMSLMQKLEQIGYGLENDLLTDSTLLTELESAIRELEQLGFYYDYIGNTSTADENGTVYGAAGNEQGPIGGGEGYADIYTTGDYIATDDNSFFAAADAAKAGEVIFIPSDVSIDISDLRYVEYRDFTITPGVIIASDRGLNGSAGGVLKLNDPHDVMFYLSDDVRLSGLVLQGPDPEPHRDISEYYPLNGIVTRGKNVVIENCEISGFSGKGILAESGDLTVRSCYIHHIRGIGAGHGIWVENADVTLEYNLFSNCRNAVTVGPEAGKVVASNNVEVGNGLESMFFLTAGETEGQETDAMPAGSADVTLTNNTVLGATLPIKLEAQPASFTAEHNLFALPEAQYDAALLYGPEAYRDSVRVNLVFRNNAFGLEEPYVLTWNEAVGADQK